ncbi:MAG TPA: iron-containing alcohol dehydrogenase [Candidatus Cloacimonadota bacterium]|nr:iron-containing alcohol dehydrogenase [Candidatus Cloacimonadota bacterium]
MKNMTFDINQVVELRTRTLDYFGVGAIQKFNDIAVNLKKDGIDKVIIVSSKSAYITTGAWDVIKPALEANNIHYILYNRVTPNPTDSSTDEATAFGRDFGAQAVIGIGGGSPIDVAKSVAIMLEYPGKTTSDLYQFKFIPEKAKPIVAINTTHGTGSEVNRFAVVTVTEKDYKPAIAYDCIYPRYAIDDPALMTKLPAHQTLYVSIDAINHVTEAATSKVASPYSVMMAKETIELVQKYLPVAIKEPGNLEARYYLTYAAAIAGIAFDNGLLHFTHALEHPLSAVKPELSHGLGLAMILPAVVKAIYATNAPVLAELYAPIVPGLKGVPEEADSIAKGIENWLFSMGVTEKLSDEGFDAKMVDRLVELSFETPSLDLLLSLAPVPATKETITKIYTESLHKSA